MFGSTGKYRTYTSTATYNLDHQMQEECQTGNSHQTAPKMLRALPGEHEVAVAARGHAQLHLGVTARLTGLATSRNSSPPISSPDPAASAHPRSPSRRASSSGAPARAAGAAAARPAPETVTSLNTCGCCRTSFAMIPSATSSIVYPAPSSRSREGITQLEDFI